MTASLAILCVAATAAVAFCVSALSGLGLAVFRRRFDELAPSAQARLLSFVALLPACMAALLMVAVLAPSFGWIADHCAGHDAPHAHPHICAGHPASGMPALPLTLLAGVLLVRLMIAMGRLVRAASLERALLRSLDIAWCEDNLGVLPFDEPHACVIGCVRPTVYVTRGLLSADHRSHLEPAVAHERAHVRRGDPLARVVAGVGLAFHVPGVASHVRQRLVRAQEMAADAEAARAIGSRERVAEALVHLARAAVVPKGLVAFSASDLEARIESLLDERPRPDEPRAAVLGAFSAAAIVVVAVGADVAHHAVEALLGLLGG